MRKCKKEKKCPITLQRKVNVAKDVFSSCHERGIKKNSGSPLGIEPQTFGFALRCSTLSHKDSSVSEVYYEVLITRVLHTARIRNVDSLMFQIEIIEMLSFELGEEDSSWGLRIFLFSFSLYDKTKKHHSSFFIELKTYHLYYFYQR